MNRLLSFKNLESFHRMIVSVSKLIFFTVHSILNTACSGKENRGLAFVFDACREDLLTNKCEKACFCLCHAAIIGKPSKIASCRFVRDVQVIFLLLLRLEVIYQQRVRGFYQGFQTPKNR